MVPYPPSRVAGDGVMVVEGGGSPFVLAHRAHSEGARCMRAVKGEPAALLLL